MIRRRTIEQMRGTAQRSFQVRRHFAAVYEHTLESSYGGAAGATIACAAGGSSPVAFCSSSAAAVSRPMPLSCHWTAPVSPCSDNSGWRPCAQGH